MNPLTPDDRGRLERAVRRGLRHEGYFGADAGQFAALAASLWHLRRCRPPDGPAALDIVIGRVRPTDPAGLYVVLRACCGMCYRDVRGLEADAIQQSIGRCASNAIEAADDNHREGKGCASRPA